MNQIGIDYQPTFTIIALNEETTLTHHPTLIGDGLREIIPNAVDGEEKWASFASQGNRVDYFAPQICNINTWKDGSGPRIFWKNIYNQCFRHLGYVPPIWENGYQLTISLASKDFGQEAPILEEIAGQAGFNLVNCIFSPEALLCKWLSQIPRPYNISEYRVMCIVMEDACIITRNYLISFENQKVNILESEMPQFLEGIGLSYWVDFIHKSLSERLGVDIPAQHDLAIRDSAIEMGIMLKNANEMNSVAWQGPLRNRLPTPFVLSKNDCFSWEKSLRYLDQIKDTVGRSILSSRSEKTVDQVIFGGPGAVCPCGLDSILENIPAGKLWKSKTPLSDIAIGATWWSQFGATSKEKVKWEQDLTTVNENIIEKATIENPDDSLIDTNHLIPPWLR